MWNYLYPTLHKKLVSLSLITLLTGCAVMDHPEDSPLGFHVISDTALRWNMQDMAVSLGEILNITLDESLTPDEQSASVIPILGRIELIAYDIGGDRLTNYSVINQYMGAFLHDVGVARDFAQREPPNLVPAGRLVKSCLACHESI